MIVGVHTTNIFHYQSKWSYRSSWLYLEWSTKFEYVVRYFLNTSFYCPFLDPHLTMLHPNYVGDLFRMSNRIRPTYLVTWSLVCLHFLMGGPNVCIFSCIIGRTDPETRKQTKSFYWIGYSLKLPFLIIASRAWTHRYFVWAQENTSR